MALGTLKTKFTTLEWEGKKYNLFVNPKTNDTIAAMRQLKVIKYRSNDKSEVKLKYTRNTEWNNCYCHSQDFRPGQNQASAKIDFPKITDYLS